LLYIQLYQKV